MHTARLDGHGAPVGHDGTCHHAGPGGGAPPLADSEDGYRTIFELSWDAIYIHDPETGAILDANQRACEMHGCTLEELKRDGIGSFTPEPSAYTWERARSYILAAAAGAPQRFEWLMISRSGAPVWMDVALHRITHLGQERVLANVRDITERKLAEEALREARGELERRVEERTAELAAANAALTDQIAERERVETALREKTFELESIFQALPDLFFRTDTEGRALEYRAGAFSDLLLPPEQFLGRTPRELFPAEIAERIEEAYRRLSTSTDPVRVEYALPSPQGEREFEGRMVPFLDGQVLLVVRDITEQKETQRALERSEQHFRFLVENGSDVTSILDAQGVSSYQSPSTERVFGYRPDEVIGTSAFERIHPDDRAACRDALALVRRNPGSIETVEARYRHRDGSWIVVEVRGRTLLADSAEAGVIVTSRDITARKAAEEALQQSEEYFRSLIESGSDIIAVTDLQGVLNYQSPSVERVLGYAPEEWIGHGADELVHPEDADSLRSAFAEVIEEHRTTHRFELRFAHRDGSWRYLEGILRPLRRESEITGVIVNARDITGRRRMEEALQEREEHFRRLIETSHDLVQTIDIRGRIAYTGPSVQRLLGYTPEEIAGLGVPDFIHPDDQPGIAAKVASALANPGQIMKAEYRVRHKDGRWRWFEALARTLSPDTAELGLVANARDITDRRDAELALSLAKEEAEQAREAAETANRAKSEFLSRMSHELRTPMNSILGFAQLLERKQLEPDQRRGVEHILRAGRHLLNLINEVLDIAGIEANRQQLSVEPVQIAPVVEEALGLIRPLALQHGCTVAEHRAPPKFFVCADRQRLTQVLLNLLSNAVKYNRPGGRVSILWERVVGDEGERLRIGVRDTGPGIPPQSLEQLFVPFERLGAERTTVEGTGLGLALSRRLMEAMGGTLTVESTVGQGSTFWAELAVEVSPLERFTAGPERPAHAAAESDPVGSATILYIEDNLANLTLVETILEPHHGVTLIPALQGQLGIELASEHRPDLILLDLHLPDIPGTEVLERLLTDPRTRRIPVVVISADATTGRIDRLVRSGAAAYLTKPLDVDRFLEIVRTLLGERGVVR